ncbi:hypothetical protein CHLRE_13g603500v5 [Chlamydomonas reinhardtii]|jgi:hypothetical protein|uniref:Uncharacterized protein n=1 Tax=Chlamydomonas reinhardtii TaxID=3055 RepID=A0A2K3D193_CHLRE|nr:uncharacterized protein CHLRE_13g603500v5 [Chlamydomonas reinhardtii]PNW74303.1 hypothetical protein CHLRE_13g603500v5 [Chlamydomonas reinhardtii]
MAISSLACKSARVCRLRSTAAPCSLPRVSRNTVVKFQQPESAKASGLTQDVEAIAAQFNDETAHKLEQLAAEAMNKAVTSRKESVAEKSFYEVARSLSSIDAATAHEDLPDTEALLAGTFGAYYSGSGSKTPAIPTAAKAHKPADFADKLTALEQEALQKAREASTHPTIGQQ